MLRAAKLRISHAPTHFSCLTLVITQFLALISIKRVLFDCYVASFCEFISRTLTGKTRMQRHPRYFGPPNDANRAASLIRGTADFVKGLGHRTLGAAGGGREFNRARARLQSAFEDDSLVNVTFDAEHGTISSWKVTVPASGGPDLAEGLQRAINPPQQPDDAWAQAMATGYSSFEQPRFVHVLRTPPPERGALLAEAGALGPKTWPLLALASPDEHGFVVDILSSPDVGRPMARVHRLSFDTPVTGLFSNSRFLLVATSARLYGFSLTDLTQPAFAVECAPAPYGDAAPCVCLTEGKLVFSPPSALVRRLELHHAKTPARVRVPSPAPRAANSPSSPTAAGSEADMGGIAYEVSKHLVLVGYAFRRRLLEMFASQLAPYSSEQERLGGAQTVGFQHWGGNEASGGEAARTVPPRTGYAFVCALDELVVAYAAHFSSPDAEAGSFLPPGYCWSAREHPIAALAVCGGSGGIAHPAGVHIAVADVLGQTADVVHVPDAALSLSPAPAALRGPSALSPLHAHLLSCERGATLARVTSLAFSHDHGVLAMCTNRGTVHVFRLSLASLEHPLQGRMMMAMSASAAQPHTLAAPAQPERRTAAARLRASVPLGVPGAGASTSPTYLQQRDGEQLFSDDDGTASVLTVARAGRGLLGAAADAVVGMHAEDEAAHGEGAAGAAAPTALGPAGARHRPPRYESAIIGGTVLALHCKLGLLQAWQLPAVTPVQLPRALDESYGAPKDLPARFSRHRQPSASRETRMVVSRSEARAAAPDPAVTAVQTAADDSAVRDDALQVSGAREPAGEASAALDIMAGIGSGAEVWDRVLTSASAVASGVTASASVAGQWASDAYRSTRDYLSAPPKADPSAPRYLGAFDIRPADDWPDVVVPEVLLTDPHGTGEGAGAAHPRPPPTAPLHVTPPPTAAGILTYSALTGGLQRRTGQAGAAGGPLVSHNRRNAAGVAPAFVPPFRGPTVPQDHEARGPGDDAEAQLFVTAVPR